MKITVTQFTNDVKANTAVVISTDKEVIGRRVDEYIQKQVHDQGLVLDYCAYLTPEGESVRFKQELELTEVPLEGCPTDEDMQVAEMLAVLDDEEYQAEMDEVTQWCEGRGYGDFQEGL